MKVKLQQIYNDGHVWEGETEIPDKTAAASLHQLSAALCNAEPSVLIYRALGASGVLLIEWIRSPAMGWVLVRSPEQHARASAALEGHLRADFMPQQATGAPNLDAVPKSELQSFADEINANLTAKARAMFPKRPVQYLAATRSLMEYAYNKVSAMNCRERGDIPAAQRFEALCEGIYSALPKYARW